MKKLVALVLTVICVVGLSACETDKYKDYHTTNMQARRFTPGDEDFFFKTNTVELITDYEKYSSYHFNLDHTERFFETNNLLVFIVTSCSSDQMEYVELREKDGLLFPLFERKKIGENQSVTADIIIHSYCVEIPKEVEYKAGEIIYNYK